MTRLPNIMGATGSSRRTAWGLAAMILGVLVFVGDAVAVVITDGSAGRVWRALMFALMTAVGAVNVNAERLRRRARERAADGLCVACGYDLRATAGRCPECGTVTA